MECIILSVNDTYMDAQEVMHMTDYSKITALYSRLSVGDEDRDGGESNSIQNQKIFLENYARGQHLTNIRHYIDDDESGRFFDRSAYSRMMDDVENGKIGVCIMKDLTRWGRDYLQVGNAMEIFRRNNVRFIAVNNGIDSEKGSIVTECGKMLLHYGYRLKILNTINFKKSMHYNPFSYIHSEKDILKLVTALIANTKGEGKAGDDFWVKAETLLYTALIGYIHYEAPDEEQNLSTLVEMVNTMEVREDDEEFQNQVDLMFEDLAKEEPEHFAVRQYKKYKLAAGVVCSKRLLNQAVWKSLRTHNLKPKKGAQVMRKNEKITALYERLSRDDFGKDDDQQRESNSISNQKAMLEEFAARQGFTNIVHFTDDGISGTCFDRPGFLAMMKEVEAGNVEYLCIKDMSRMGRDYLKVGQIMEILRQRGVRLIAINDGVDSARGDDDFTPFRNIMNEYYARDTSRKIRSTFQSKGKSGKHLTGTVIYGYLWNEARDQWLVDPEAADVVKRIFAMTIDGYGPYQIASKLKEEKVLIPSAYLAQHGEGVNKNKTFKDVYGWGSSTICNILEKREYLGHTINFKTRKHFKDKKSHYVPEDEWTIFENTHEAIIDQTVLFFIYRIDSG